MPVVAAILSAIGALLAALFRRPASDSPQGPVGAPLEASAPQGAPLPTPEPPKAPEAPQAAPVAPAAPVVENTEIETLALTVWAEARGEPVAGQVGVTWVIRNRAARPRWWGRSISEVCLKPYQFSCWLPSDPQSLRLKDPATKRLQSYKSVLAVVKDVLAGKHPDPTGGADHYCTKAVAATTKWAKGATPIAVIGGHNFYRLEA